MLQVIRNDGGAFTWHVGSPLPANYTMVHNVSAIKADCDELELILRICEGIPTVHGGRVVAWYGDHAKFIFSALASHTNRNWVKKEQTDPRLFNRKVA